MCKYLLCRPRGGLNDTLCQIEVCWSYCEKYNRVLIIDTTRSGLRVNFSELFENNTRLNYEFKLSDEIFEKIKNLNCQITEIDNKLMDYKVEYSKENNFVTKDTKVRVSFDFEKNYDEDLLVFEQCGGGTKSIDLLSKLKLSSELRGKFTEFIISENYESIHVRNTDYQTDYKKLFESLREPLKNKLVLICSDDLEVIESAKIILNESTIISKTSNDFVEKGIPLHSPYQKLTKEQEKLLAENSIIDLLLLANSSKINYSNLSGYSFNKLSGFTKLALLLNQNRELLKKLFKN